MDLYTRTALTSTRHSDLLAEAKAARLVADGTPHGFGALLRAAGAQLTGLVSEARSARLVRTSPHKASSHS